MYSRVDRCSSLHNSSPSSSNNPFSNSLFSNSLFNSNSPRPLIVVWTKSLPRC